MFRVTFGVVIFNRNFHIVSRCSFNDIFCVPIRSHAFAVELSSFATSSVVVMSFCQIHARFRFFAELIEAFPLVIWYEETLNYCVRKVTTCRPRWNGALLNIDSKSILPNSEDAAAEKLTITGVSKKSLDAVVNAPKFTIDSSWHSPDFELTHNGFTFQAWIIVMVCLTVAVHVLSKNTFLSRSPNSHIMGGAISRGGFFFFDSRYLCVYW